MIRKLLLLALLLSACSPSNDKPAASTTSTVPSTTTSTLDPMLEGTITIVATFQTRIADLEQELVRLEADNDRLASRLNSVDSCLEQIKRAMSFGGTRYVYC